MGALKDYREVGIKPEQAHTNAWKLTLLSAVAWKLFETKNLYDKSKLIEYIKYMNDSFTPEIDNALYNFTRKAKDILGKVKTEWISFDWGTTTTPIRIIDEIIKILQNEWPVDKKVRILIDRLDDCWDASEESKNLIIGLLKASNELNAIFDGKVIVTIFIRSDIYDNLFFGDQDKYRQYEETLYWNSQDLKKIVCERVRVSLNLNENDYEKIWMKLFSKKTYRSRASAEKYIIDRTFKRPRDIISFVRFAIEQAINNGHSVIEPEDTRAAEEEKYSQSKYKDLIIEYQNQLPYIKNLLDSFSGSLHKLTKEEIIAHLKNFKETNNVQEQPSQILRDLFNMGFIGIKRQGRAGLKQRGGARFYYYYDDPSINPLSYNEFYIHPSVRHYLNITESRRK